MSSFWGVEVKPGKPYCLEDSLGRIQITQATLGTGSSEKKSTVQCKVGDQDPIFLCTLLPERLESCPLHLEFEDDEEVTFSVIGLRSVHLSGFSVRSDQDFVGDDYDSDSFGEDIAETESESTDYDSEDEYEDDFIDDSDIEMFPSSHTPNKGVVIEEIVDDEKASNGKSGTREIGNEFIESNENSNIQRQIVAKSDTAQVLESEDEDGFPISAPQNSDFQKAKEEPEEKMDKGATGKAKKRKNEKDDGEISKKSKRKPDNPKQENESKRKKKTATKKQNKEANSYESGSEQTSNAHREGDIEHGDTIASNMDDSSSHGTKIKKCHPDKVGLSLNGCRSLSGAAGNASVENCSEEKKKKKKKKKTKTPLSEGHAEKDVDIAAGDIRQSSVEMEEKTNQRPSQVRTFGNGLVVEELVMGKPDGRKAIPGKKVSVHYIGKLKKSGRIIDSTVGRAPYKFRLGVGQVIKGWDVGVQGMRIGDKRRLIIPPSMGYGDKRTGSIPPNSWLVFDVELADVQ